jgi:hypothetical protein
MDRHFLEMPIEVELDNSNVTAGLLIIEFLAESEGNATQYFKHIKRGRLTMKGSKENVLSYLKYGDHPMQGKDEATFDRVYYLWVDGPVTVTIKDRNSTYGGETSIQKGGILNLSKGWNALHRKAVVSFVNGNFQVVSSVILDNPNLKWCSGGWD